MRRRTFTLISACAAVRPLVSRAQPALPIIGIFVAGQPDPALFLKEFQDGLRKLGYVDHKNIVLEIRSAGSTDPGRLRNTVRELVGLKPKVIVCYQTPTAMAAKDVTHDIPIVMAGVGDAVGTGLVASLAHPGGNITGISTATAETSAKNVELLRELVPATKRVGALFNANDPFSKPFLARIRTAAPTIGVEIRAVAAHGAVELEAAFAEMMKDPVDAVVIQPSLGSTRPAELALKYRLPAASPNEPFARSGGLLVYTSDQPTYFHAAAGITDKILRGAKPADLPVQEPARFNLVINTRTAKLLGVTVPPVLLTRADQLIE